MHHLKLSVFTRIVFHKNIYLKFNFILIRSNFPIYLNLTNESYFVPFKYVLSITKYKIYHANRQRMFVGSIASWRKPWQRVREVDVNSTRTPCTDTTSSPTTFKAALCSQRSIFTRCASQWYHGDEGKIWVFTTMRRNIKKTRAAVNWWKNKTLAKTKRCRADWNTSTTRRYWRWKLYKKK